MRRCKHENADHLAPDYDTRGLTGWARCEQLRCIDCGAWLSLGPSNDEPEAVRIEIRAAEIAANGVGVGSTDLVEAFGWAIAKWGNRDTPIYVGQWCGYLAHEIVTHTEGK